MAVAEVLTGLEKGSGIISVVTNGLKDQVPGSAVLTPGNISTPCNLETLLGIGRNTSNWLSYFHSSKWGIGQQILSLNICIPCALEFMG